MELDRHQGFHWQADRNSIKRKEREGHPGKQAQGRWSSYANLQHSTSQMTHRQIIWHVKPCEHH